MLLSSQFQGYCRDLHSEAVDHIARSVRPLPLQDVLQTEFSLHLKLDRGNPNLGNVGADFNRLGLKFLDKIRERSARNQLYVESLEDLNRWRNAIAHQDFDPLELGGTIKLHLSRVRRWRRACEHLAFEFDIVIAGHIAQITGTQPW